MSDEYELFDPTLDEYDPARRRRRWAYDPARRRKRRGGRMPAGLRRYWAARRKGKASSYHPSHRGRGRHRRRRFKFDPIRRFGRRRGRRYDPGFGSAGSWTRGATDYLGVAAGSILHNFLVHGKGFLSKTLNLGPTNMTQLGLAAGVGGIVAEHMGYVTPNGIFSDVLKGMFAEGFNVPGVESIARSGGGGSLISDGNGGSIMNPPGAATASALGVGPAGYIPVWAYT